MEQNDYTLIHPQRTVTDIQTRENIHGLYLFYGTLRSGQHNNLRYPTLQRIGDPIRVCGFKMYDFGVPIIVPESDPKESVVMERFFIPDNRTRKSIAMLESGYVYGEMIPTGLSDIPHGFYFDFGSIAPNVKIVPHGDWVAYITQKSNRYLSPVDF